jgi:sensor histidine kinase YesM
LILKWFKNTSSSIPTKYHILFWVCYFTFNVIRWGSYFDDYWYSFRSNIVAFPPNILLAYFNIYFLIPKFILKKKYRSYILYFSISLLLIYVLRTGLIYFLISENIWPEAYEAQDTFSFNHLVVVLLGELYIVALATAIKLAVDWIYERKRVEKLEEIQLKTELDFLKSQIQPHFFFNTLNNLYALTIEKSDIAPSVVLKLSDIMQYVLYDVREPKIRLYDEIKYIQNYIDLERLRYGDRIDSNTEIKGEISNIMVPPLLFLPFIENCFKHGVKANDKIEVEISFEMLKNKILLFKVVNSFDQLTNMDSNQGIGIQNVKRRLELLFKKTFKLKTTIDKKEYCVELKIPVE